MVDLPTCMSALAILIVGLNLYQTHELHATFNSKMDKYIFLTQESFLAKGRLQMREETAAIKEAADQLIRDVHQET
jgi:hypothetical protein